MWRLSLVALVACHHPAAKPATPVHVEPLTADAVLAKIRGQYLGGVRKCYSVLLKHHASARGKVLIAFTVDAQGRATHGEAHGLANDVDACIVATMASWEFPRPQGGEASFAVPLDLMISE